MQILYKKQAASFANHASSIVRKRRRLMQKRIKEVVPNHTPHRKEVQKVIGFIAAAT